MKSLSIVFAWQLQAPIAALGEPFDPNVHEAVMQDDGAGVLVHKVQAFADFAAEDGEKEGAGAGAGRGRNDPSQHLEKTGRGPYGPAQWGSRVAAALFCATFHLPKLGGALLRRVVGPARRELLGLDRLLVADQVVVDEVDVPAVAGEVERFELAEIAELLALPLGTVKSRIARGRRALGELLGNQDDPDDVGVHSD